MATDKVGLKTSVEEFMNSYTPIYQPIYPLFLGKSKAYSQMVGTADLRYINTIGELKAPRLLPKDTEIAQIAAIEGSKTFKKYFFANQFQVSHLQSQEGNDDVVAQVLDEHNLQMDQIVLLGDGTSSSNMLNNSLYWSNDPNYILETSSELASASAYLPALHNSVMAAATKADRVAGRKLIIFYGTLALPLYTSLYSAAVRPFKSVMQEVLGPNYSFAQLPAAVTPSGANGFIVVNLDQVLLHYTMLPTLDDQGNNAEKKYFWYNFMMGSAMLEVKSSGGIVRQPITLAA